MKEYANIMGSHPSQRLALYKDARGQKIGVGLFDPLQGKPIAVGMDRSQTEVLLNDILDLFEELWGQQFKRREKP
jgi:hypothetical protein